MKSKSIKKVLALFCVGIMSCGLLAGCGGNGGNETVDNTVEDTKNLKIMQCFANRMV